MPNLTQQLKLYAVTDRHWLAGRTLVDCVTKALAGGVSMVQLREKHMAQADFIAEACAIKKVCQTFQVPFLINDDLAVAQAVDADGIHVGQADLDAAAIKAQWGPNKIVGVSAQTVAQAQAAQAAGADYLGVGAVFPTATKTDAVSVSIATLQAITAAVTIPVVAIGGIHAENLLQLQHTGIVGVALVSELFDQADIQTHAAQLAQLSAQLSPKAF
ncbi:thiamine phosphate synthase [Lacticaseibacillus baoqingensis]|uniref:Thiamine-phosphate synthase n=1 Tax=Lacticaseibacillus baoqingensis TaxID=2486013 RepID=A0ABW4E8G9_9LACO|nr:thiamine phosphate synthase [Lacticaseibacillus baoqingensis]